MKEFMDQDFLLESQTARHLYHDIAEKLPIIDYHCHLSPQEIYEDAKYDNITQVWLGGDHYKWRQMRSNGVEESLVTGAGDDYDKFFAWAGTLEKAIGNPLYHWSHLELQRYFGYKGNLNRQTAQEVWDLTAEKLQNGLTARELIRQSNVEVICTTDDPVDSLQWHKLLKEEGFATKVLPTWRPDKALGIEKEGFADYISQLSSVSGIEIFDFDSLLQALDVQMEHFDQVGCKVSDHGLATIAYEPATEDEVDAILKKALAGVTVSTKEMRQYQTALMIELGKRYASRDWAMQLHFGVQRDLNQNIFAKLGPDAGIDAIADQISAVELGRFLNALNQVDGLPKTILYSLNPNDNAAIGTVMGCFQDSSAVGKIQHGSAWWFNDNKIGMEEQLTSLANLGLLGNFVGMLTDSRSFLSYTRHEYFRRILCNLIGNWVEKGEFPADDALLEPIIKGISYENAKRYFGF